MRNYKARNVDEYISSAPPEAQSKLKEVRETIKLAVPDAEESISWGVPFYKYHGLLAGFSAGKGYVLFGLVSQLDNSILDTLEKNGYATGKKTFKIKFNQEVPKDIINQILQARIKINQAKSL